MLLAEDGTKEAEPEEPWLLLVDGSTMATRSRADFIIVTPMGVTIEYALQFVFSSTNNEAKYEALIAGLRMSIDMGATKVHASLTPY